MNYKEKYFIYKNKYLELKNNLSQIGGNYNKFVVSYKLKLLKEKNDMIVQNTIVELSKQFNPLFEDFQRYNKEPTHKCDGSEQFVKFPTKEEALGFCADISKLNEVCDAIYHGKWDKKNKRYIDKPEVVKYQGQLYF